MSTSVITLGGNHLRFAVTLRRVLSFADHRDRILSQSSAIRFGDGSSFLATIITSVYDRLGEEKVSGTFSVGQVRFCA